MIEGVAVKQLVPYGDQRQVFREVIRVTDDFFDAGFGQLSYVLMYPGAAKAWHLPTGALKLGLYDMRPDSSTSGQLQELLLGPDTATGHVVVAIPPLVAHGCRVIGGPTQVFYVTSRVYDPTDEGRLPHDDPSIGYDWTAGPPIT
jgi:dTDP-4-dehydrorhamnose 3,5-epimerase